MKNLSENKCLPCEGGVRPLGRAEAKILMKELPGWKLSDDAKSIRIEYRMHGFAAAVDCIDAIARIVYAPACEFDSGCFPLAYDKPSPFNSQNIFITQEVLPHFFVLPHLTPRGRMGDI